MTARIAARMAAPAAPPRPPRGAPVTPVGLGELVSSAGLIAGLSVWIDTAPANARRDGEAAMWGRVVKIAEEIAEVEAAGAPDAVVRLLTRQNGRLVEAVIGVTAQNPRKGITHSWEDVLSRLWSVTLAALLAVPAARGEVRRELLDVALTALCAVEHLTHNAGGSAVVLIQLSRCDRVDAGALSALCDHVRFVACRARVTAVEPAAELAAVVGGEVR